MPRNEQRKADPIPAGTTMYVSWDVRDMIRVEAASRGMTMTNCLRQIMQEVQGRRIKRDRQRRQKP